MASARWRASRGGLSAEPTFYVKILGFEPADRLPSLEIVNLPSGGE
jgi:hypothetical protein